jgi:hypothetical protein
VRAMRDGGACDGAGAVGDLHDLTETLGHLAGTLGITAVWVDRRLDLTDDLDRRPPDEQAR